MKIKIVKNKPLNEMSSDITHLIGKVFEAKIDCEGHADIPLDGGFTIFKGEYEIVEEDKD